MDGIVIGIVGSEAAKFIPDTEMKARQAIRELLPLARLVVSGKCHLGGIDIWAIEEAKEAGIPTREFPPRTHSWTSGYMPRNKQIAEASDLVVCITLKELPPHYTGMRFPLCYHCNTKAHVKSGGCWTTKYARSIGREWRTVVVAA